MARRHMRAAMSCRSLGAASFAALARYFAATAGELPRGRMRRRRGWRPLAGAAATPRHILLLLRPQTCAAAFRRARRAEYDKLPP